MARSHAVSRELPSFILTLLFEDNCFPHPNVVKRVPPQFTTNGPFGYVKVHIICHILALHTRIFSNKSLYVPPIISRQLCWSSTLTSKASSFVYDPPNSRNRDVVFSHEIFNIFPILYFSRIFARSRARTRFPFITFV